MSINGDYNREIENVGLENLGNETMSFTTTNRVKSEYGSESAAKPDAIMLRRVIGGAVENVYGVLGLRRGVRTYARHSPSFADGVHIHVTDDNRLNVGLKLITDDMCDPALVIEDVTGTISGVLSRILMQEPREIKVIIYASMSETEFENKYR